MRSEELRKRRLADLPKDPLTILFRSRKSFWIADEIRRSFFKTRNTQKERMLRKNYKKLFRLFRLFRVFRVKKEAGDAPTFY